MATTLDPNNTSASLTLSNGNLTVFSSAPNAWRQSIATSGTSSGKWYWEATVDAIGGSSDSIMIGVVQTYGENSQVGALSTGYGCHSLDGDKWTNGTEGGYGSSYTTNDVIMIALDMDNGKIYWGENGTWYNSGDPANQTNPAFTGLTGVKYPAISCYRSSSQVTFNFGATAFTYTPPSGFSRMDELQGGITPLSSSQLFFDPALGIFRRAGETDTVISKGDHDLGNDQGDIVTITSSGTLLTAAGALTLRDSLVVSGTGNITGNTTIGGVLTAGGAGYAIQFTTTSGIIGVSNDTDLIELDGTIGITINNDLFFGANTISGTGDIYAGNLYGDGSNLTGLGSNRETGNYKAGRTALALNDTSKAVVFGGAYGDTNYTIGICLTNTTDSPPAIYGWVVTAKATTGFTVSFSGPIDSNNYVLEWTAIHDD